MKRNIGILSQKTFNQHYVFEQQVVSQDLITVIWCVLTIIYIYYLGQFQDYKKEGKSNDTLPYPVCFLCKQLNFHKQSYEKSIK